MWLKTHFARSGHIYQHEVKYIIINHLLNKFNVINYSLHPEFTIKVLGTCTQVLLKVLVLVLKYFWKSSTCTCTRHFFKYLYLYSSTFVQYSPQAESRYPPPPPVGICVDHIFFNLIMYHVTFRWSADFPCMDKVTRGHRSMIPFTLRVV